MADLPRPIRSGRPWLPLVLVLGVLAASGVVGFSSGAFSDTTSNGGNSFSTAVSFCGNPGTQTLVADEDSYVDENAPASNYGNAASLQVQSRQGGRNRRTLVHFPIPAGSLCTVASATLRLWATSASGGRTLQAYEAAVPWTEGTVTWLTQPPTTGSPSTTTSAAGWIQFDVTSQVQSMLLLNAGFLVKDASESQNPPATQQLSSSEAASYRPELVITLA
jgi:hypothetical protein